MFGGMSQNVRKLMSSTVFLFHPKFSRLILVSHEHEEDRVKDFQGIFGI